MIPYIKIVQQYELLSVFWLGKFVGLKHPGLQLMVWAVPQDADDRLAGGW